MHLHNIERNTVTTSDPTRPDPTRGWTRPCPALSQVQCD